MTTTAYLDLFLRSISEPALLEIFLRFILLHQHENVHILDTLTSRINTPFRVRKAPEEGNLQLKTDFRRVCFWNKIMKILFSLSHCFSIWEEMNQIICFAIRSPSVREVGVTAFHRTIFLNLSGLALSSVEPAECASEETWYRGTYGLN